MQRLISNLSEFKGRDVVETVVTDLREHVIGKEGEFFDSDYNEALLAALADDTKIFYRLLYTSLSVWGHLDSHITSHLISLAERLHGQLRDIENQERTIRFERSNIQQYTSWYSSFKNEHFFTTVSSIASTRYLISAGLYDEDPETTQNRLDVAFLNFSDRVARHVAEQTSTLQTAIKGVVAKKVSEQTLQEIDEATTSMRRKARWSAILAIMIAASAIAFVLYYAENNVEGSYLIAASITRRVTILSIGFVAIGILIRLFRSYVSSIESLKHKRRLIQSFQELLVMGGTENSEHVFSNLIAILVRPDFSMNPSEKASEVDVATVSSAVAQVLKSSGKS